MDLSIVRKKLESKGCDSYSSPESFVADIRLIFSNCAKYYKVNFWTMNVTWVSVYVCCRALITTDIPVQITSEVGSAGMYLEDYFEDQLKQIYPDKVFPGGREEQMIPPLEDEIEEDEEEMAVDGTAPVVDTKVQSPSGGGIAPVEEDFPQQEEEMPKPNNPTDVNDKGIGTETKVESAFIPVDKGNSPAKQTQGSAISGSDTNYTECSSLKEKNPEISADQPEEAPEARQEPPLSSDKPKVVV